MRDFYLVFIYSLREVAVGKATPLMLKAKKDLIRNVMISDFMIMSYFIS